MPEATQENSNGVELNQQDIARFDAFLDGKLSPTEEQGLLTSLRDDAAYKAAFHEHRELRQAFRSHGRSLLKGRLTTVQAGLNDTPVEKYRSANSRGFRKFFKGLFIATALIATGYLAFDQIGHEDRDAAPAVQGDSGLDLPLDTITKPVIPTEVKRAPTAKTTRRQVTRVDTIEHTIIVSGDAQEIQRQIDAKTKELQDLNPEIPVLIEDSRE